jgi:hypothetical protein
MMSTGVLETCKELEWIYTKKKIVRQVGYLQELKLNIKVYYVAQERTNSWRQILILYSNE